MNKYSPYILYLLISVLMAVLFVNGFGPLHSLQRSLDDMLMGLSADEERVPNVVIVRVDGLAEKEYGEWPWDHDLIADLSAAVASAKPTSILIDLELNEDAAQDSAGNTAILDITINNGSVSELTHQ